MRTRTVRVPRVTRSPRFRRAAKPSARGDGKRRAGKLALLVGAAGLALKSRDRLPGPLGRRDRAEPLPPEPAAATPDTLAAPAPEPEREPVQR